MNCWRKVPLWKLTNAVGAKSDGLICPATYGREPTHFCLHHSIGDRRLVLAMFMCGTGRLILLPFEYSFPVFSLRRLQCMHLPLLALSHDRVCPGPWRANGAVHSIGHTPR